MFLMSYGYNPSSQSPAKGFYKPSVVENVTPTNRTKNEDAVDMKTFPVNNHINKMERKKVLNYLHTIEKRAEVTNDLAKKQNLPYRLKIHTVDNTKVLLDVIIVDKDEKELSRITHDVTNNNFSKLIDNISTGSGLIIDDLPSSNT